MKPILGDGATELWYKWLAADWQEKKDLEVTIQMIAEKVLKNNPLEERKILLPPPTEEQAEGSFILGNVIYKDNKLFPLHLNDEDFIKQIGIFSVTGGGKTNVGMLMALQLLKKGTPFMVIDWKRTWRSMLSLKDHPGMEKVQVYTVGRDVIPFLWNPFRPPPNIDYRTWISVIVECLEKSHLAGLGVGDFFIRIYEKLFQDVKDKNFYPNFYDGLRELEKIRPDGREYLWWQSTKRIMRSFTFGPSSKSFNARNPIKLEELLEQYVILELDQEMPKPLRIFFTELILRFIHLYRLSQGETAELRHCAILEEIHNLARKSTFKRENEIDSLENVFREIRSFGQGLVSITQHPSLLPIHILGNAHTLLFLALQHEDDIEAARESLFLPREEQVYLNMLKTGFGIAKIMERITPCLVQFLYVPVEKGVITDEWLRINRQGYLLPDSDGNSHETEGYLRGEERKPEIPEIREIPLKESPAKKLLIDILQYPLASVTERYKRQGFNARHGNRYKKMLVTDGLIQSKIITTHSGWITLFELTPKGKVTLRDFGYQVSDEKEGVIHKYWKHAIEEYYKGKGFEVLVEARVNGKPDIIVISGGKKICVEVETGLSNYLDNIFKNLKAGFDEIICVATNEEVESKIKQEVENKNIVDKRIKIISVFSFGF